ncbi:hypothetical protein YM3MPS_45590 [Mycobacterium pseudoshottsii]|nr:hypothetical protein YM3MPS_45590 [Mycobacterium pseudoshottsii]
MTASAPEVTALVTEPVMPSTEPTTFGTEGTPIVGKPTVGTPALGRPTPGMPTPGMPTSGTPAGGGNAVRAEPPASRPPGRPDPPGMRAAAGTAGGCSKPGSMACGASAGVISAGPAGCAASPGGFGIRTDASRSHCCPAVHAPWLGACIGPDMVSGETATVPPTMAAAATPTTPTLMKVPSRIRPRRAHGSMLRGLGVSGPLRGRWPKFVGYRGLVC